VSIVSGLILFAVLIFLLILGVPIAVSLGLCALLGAYFSNIPLADLAARFANSGNPDILSAIPFFLLCANLMSGQKTMMSDQKAARATETVAPTKTMMSSQKAMQAGDGASPTGSAISKRLILFINSFLGKIPGGLNYAAVLACALFSALAGAAPITVIAIGSVLYAQMVELGYPKNTSAGLFASAGSLGSIIPPSVIMIVYASMSKADVKDMFAAGAKVGIVLTLAFLLICFFLGRRQNIPKNNQKFVFLAFLKEFSALLPAIFVPIIILGGIFSKLLTPVQAGAIASAYALLIGVFVYKSLDMEALSKAFLKSVSGAAMILFIIVCANTFSFVFMKSQLPALLESFVLSMKMTPIAFCLITALTVILIGIIIDGAAICILLVPALLGIAKTLGISDIHFGMIICVGAVLGSMTPPVAVSIFAAKTFSGLELSDIVKGQAPFFIAFCIVYLLMTILPLI
jgi:C4-dicarboxylate transporter DctM subunit